MTKTKWTNFNNQVKKLVDWKVVAEEILGLTLVGEPLTTGWTKCLSVDGHDDNPSAGYNLETGYYKDFRDGQEACSTYDLMCMLQKADTFMEAKKIIAKKFGIKWPATDPSDPEHGVTWQQWSDNLAKPFCNRKKPITLEGLKRAGARMCMRFKDPCFALPIMGSSKSLEPVGWMFFPRNGQPFQYEAAKGAKAICKVQAGETPAFVTSPEMWEEINSTAGKNIVWCEGGPDMLAGMSMFPNEIFVTNAHGCSSPLNDRQKLAVINGEHVLTIVADADTPGIRGAIQKFRDFGESRANVRVLTTSAEIDEKHGKDYRDHLLANQVKFCCEGLVDPPQELKLESQAKIEQMQQEEILEEEERFENIHMKASLHILDRVGLQVIGCDPAGKMCVYSKNTRAVLETDKIAQMKYHTWLQFAGPKFYGVVAPSMKEWEARVAAGDKNAKTMIEFQTALTIASSQTELREYDRVGAGIWPVIDKDGDHTGDVLIIKRGEAYRYTMDGLFTKLESPVCERSVADFGTKFDWFDEKVLANYLKQAHDPDWRGDVYKELYRMLDGWRWQNDSMVQLTIGLIMATTIQTMHSWRPMVALTGESNSGKTMLMMVISRLFGRIAQFSARSTAAGVLQNLGYDARPILLDEFDSGPEQAKLMKVFRAASRGQETLMGTCTHAGKSYRIVHIPWMSGIHASSRDQADLNRMIPLRILTALKNARTLEIADQKELKDLGLKMIAGVIVTSQAALELAGQLMKTKGSKIPSRYRESYSVPYANLGAFLGIDGDAINEVMTDYLTKYVLPEIEAMDAQTDQEAVLLDILQSEVKLGPNAPEDVASVAEILFDPRFSSFRDTARTKGVGYIKSKKGHKVCFVGRRLTTKSGVLGFSIWADIPNILQILERLPDELKPKKEKQMVAGTTATVVSVDYNILKAWVKNVVGNRDDDCWVIPPKDE